MSKEEENRGSFKISETAIKKVDALLNMDKDDESLMKWKEQLLGQATAENFSRMDQKKLIFVL